MPDATIRRTAYPVDEVLTPQARPPLRIAMRADKTNQSFAAIIHSAAAVINRR